MIIKVVKSEDYKNKLLRIKRLPQFMDKFIMGYTKKNILEIKKLFHDGIKDDTFGLEDLAESTIKRKTSQGFSQPDTPLYGKGDEDKERSYVNMLNVRKLKNGWKLYPSWKKHWTYKIQLRELLYIHEHGAKIIRGDKIIQIKPRPAFLLAYRRWLSQSKQGTKSKELKKALIKYINEADRKLMKRFEDFNNR